MKIFGALVVVLIIGVCGLAYRVFWLSEQAMVSSAALESANERIGQLEQRILAYEDTNSALAAELQRLMSLSAEVSQSSTTSNPSRSVSGGTVNPQTTVPSNTTPQTANPVMSSPEASTLAIETWAIADFDAATFFSGQGPASPPELAKATLVAVQTAQQFGDYLTNHPFMNRQMGQLAMLASSILEDDGSDPAATARTAARIAGTAGAAALNFRNLSNGMRSDFPEVNDQSAQLQEMMNAINARKSP